jgi:hypothetical protein
VKIDVDMHAFCNIWIVPWRNGMCSEIVTVCPVFWGDKFGLNSELPSVSVES